MAAPTGSVSVGRSKQVENRRTGGGPIAASLTSQTLVIIRARRGGAGHAFFGRYVFRAGFKRHLNLAGFGRGRFGGDRAVRIGGPLDRFGAAVIKALHALLPGRPVQHVEIPFFDIPGQKDVYGLSLANVRRAVGGELDNPALVELESGLEDVLLGLVEAIEMLNRALSLQDGSPDFIRILTF